MCLSKRGLYPKESNRLGASGVQFGAWDPQNTGHQPSICGQEPFFRRFYNKDLFLCLNPRSRKIYASFFFFFLVFTQEFVEFCEYFVMKTFFFMVFTLEFEGKKFLCPPKVCFCPPPPPPPVTLLWHRACAVRTKINPHSFLWFYKHCSLRCVAKFNKFNKCAASSEHCTKAYNLKNCICMLQGYIEHRDCSLQRFQFFWWTTEGLF